MSLLVALDRQHVGKPHALSDLGAWGDLDQDGEHDVLESEAIWTAPVLLSAEMRLRELGHRIYPITHGRYSDRHAAANAVKADVYVAGHLNSLTGGTRSGQTGNYAAVFYDHRTRKGNGDALAEAIAAELSRFPVFGSRVRIWPARPDDWTHRAYSTIKGVTSPVAICYEPAFLDYRPHQDAFFTPEKIGLLGVALADGIHAWGQRRANT